jgi:hypothetical protein
VRHLVVLVALAVPLVAADGATACSCAPLDEREQIAASDGAFIGRLLAVREVDPRAEGEPIGSGDPTDFIYRVGRVYNGGPGLRRGRKVRVRSVRSEVTCGLPRGRGMLIGLFVDRENRRWHGNLCRAATPARMRQAGDGSVSRSAAGSPHSPGSATPCGHGRAG